MIFEFDSIRDKSTLRAHFESGDVYTGKRQEGAGTEITYSGAEITFNYGVGSIHPDLLGLLCLIIFYPFIGQRVVFPMPVSPRLEAAFRRPSFKRSFTFDNVDPRVEKYSGSRMAISFGGGIDSSAIRVMFPEAFVVHEAHLRDGEIVPSYAHDIVRGLGSEKGRLVTTNQRYVSSPGGWHGWTCAFATSLLLATDYDFGIILMGMIMGSSMLNNGVKYWDKFAARKYHGPTGNFWQSAFDDIGIPVFSPVCGASEFLTMQLSLDLARQGDIVYCIEGDGSACLKCTKCFRRDMIRAVIDPKYRPDWKPYDRSEVHEFLECRPLYFCHIFSFAKDRIRKLPSFISRRLKDIPSILSDWPMRIDSRSFELCDKEWRSPIRDRVLEYWDPMEPGHVAELKAWDVTRPPDNPKGWWRSIRQSRSTKRAWLRRDIP